MQNKMTIAEKFDDVINFITDEGQVTLSKEEIVDFLNDRKIKAVKKGGSRKATARQKENEGVKDIIVANLTSEGQTVTALLGKMNIEGLTNQRVSALLRQLVLDGKVIKTVEGKKSYFSVA